MTKRKAYAKPSIAVEDFVMNQFIAGFCNISIKQAGWKEKLTAASPLYADIVKAGYFAEGIAASCTLLATSDDILCYHTQGGPLIAS